MTGLNKFRIKKNSLAFLPIAICIALTTPAKSNCYHYTGIYSTLTNNQDTTKPLIKNTTLPSRNARDTSLKINDTIPSQRIDSFSLKLSKDTLDAPVQYEAEDSAVVLIKEKKIILYGKTKTVYQDIILTAPKVELDQQTNILTAVADRDSLGDIITRARFERGPENFESDTITFNFKTQRGLTKNTFTQQDELFVQGETIKKINNNTFFVSRGRFTTCNLDDPHFAFRANKLKVINNKVAVSGPAHPEFESVPIPVYLPFGFYPLNRGRHSGLLPPTFTTNEQWGLGLEGLGYYKVLNDYFDITLRGNIYSYGGWSANLTPTYRKRYRYNGQFNLSLQHTKQAFKGDPDYNLIKTFNVFWSHVVDQRARPGVNFSANVNAGSTKYNQYIPNNPNRNFQNQLSSSIAFSKTWIGKPYNLTLSANHSQNNATRLVQLVLPDAGFTVNTIYPLQSKNMVGTPKWYQKLGLGYNGTFRNQLAFYDTAKNSLNKILDTLRWGAQHRIPISLSLPPVGPFVIAPSISYEETWLTHRVRRAWNDIDNKVDTISDQKGFFTDRQMTFGIGVSTAVFGTFQFKNSKVQAIRHVIRPSISFNYKPDLSKKYYDVIQVDTQNHISPISQFDQNNLFGGYGLGKFGGVSFSVDNNLEMKVRSKKDTSNEGIKKVRLIDGFGFNGSYNLVADSFRLSPISLYLRSTLFDKLNLTAQAQMDPYAVDAQGFRRDRFVWQDGRFTPGRITGGSIALSTDFKSKPRDGSQPAPEGENQGQITDPTLLADQERLMEYMRRNPAEFVDFNIPWQIGLSYSLSFTRQFQPGFGGFQTVVNSNVSFNGSFSLTPKWNFTANGYYDFDTKKLQTFSMSINREMHCWQMSISVTPIGLYRFFSININPKASILQDLRVNRTRYFTNY